MSKKRKKICPVGLKRGNHDPSKYDNCTCPVPDTNSKGEDRLDRFTAKFKKIIDEERKKYGSAYIMAKGQGGILYALVSEHRTIYNSQGNPEDDIPF